MLNKNNTKQGERTMNNTNNRRKVEDMSWQEKKL
jgi:hypothetical protein